MRGPTPTEKWSVVGGIPYEPQSSEGYLMPVLRRGGDSRYFSQLAYDDTWGNFQLWELELGSSGLVPLLEPVAVNPHVDRIIVFLSDGSIKFAGHLSAFKENLHTYLTSGITLPVLLQTYELVGDLGKAKDAEEQFLAELVTVSGGARESFVRSSSRSMFYSIAAQSIKSSKDATETLDWITRVSKYVNDWTISDLDAQTRAELVSKLTVTEGDFDRLLAERKPDAHNYIASQAEDSFEERAQATLKEIKSLSRQELRLGRLLRRLNEDPTIAEALFEIYRPTNKYETYGVDLIQQARKEHAENDPWFYRRVIGPLFDREYPLQKGILLKDLARELGAIPAANKAIREVYRSSHRWAVHIWKPVIEAYLDGRILTNRDEYELQRRHLHPEKR